MKEFKDQIVRIMKPNLDAKYQKQKAKGKGTSQ